MKSLEIEHKLRKMGENTQLANGCLVSGDFVPFNTGQGTIHQYSPASANNQASYTTSSNISISGDVGYMKGGTGTIGKGYTYQNSTSYNVQDFNISYTGVTNSAAPNIK
jgi:hypothetical protein